MPDIFVRACSNIIMCSVVSVAQSKRIMLRGQRSRVRLPALIRIYFSYLFCCCCDLTVLVQKLIFAILNSFSFSIFSIWCVTNYNIYFTQYQFLSRTYNLKTLFMNHSNACFQKYPRKGRVVFQIVKSSRKLNCNISQRPRGNTFHIRATISVLVFHL